jgi:hypothetical protein
MKAKLLEKLKTTYSHLGFSDDALNDIAEKRIEMGGVSDENLDEVAESFGVMLKPLQREIDRRVSSVKKDSLSEREQLAKSLNYSSWAEMLNGIKERKDGETEVETGTPPASTGDDKLLNEIAEMRKYIDELRQDNEKRLNMEKNKQFTKTVKEKLTGEKGCNDDVFLKLVLHELDAQKSIDENVESLRKRYDEEASAARTSGYYVPELASRSIVNKVDDKVLDANEKEFAKSIKENIKIG